MYLKKVETNEDLQRLVTYTILTKEKTFSTEDILEEVLKSEFFNEFCEKDKLFERIESTLNNFVKLKELNTFYGRYVVKK